jgi:hypothetical protein
MEGMMNLYKDITSNRKFRMLLLQERPNIDNSPELKGKAPNDRTVLATHLYLAP